MKLEVPITGLSGQGRSIRANSAMTTNAYIELSNDGKPALTGRHGMKTEFVLPRAPIRGCIEDKDFSYWVAGNRFHTVDKSYNIKDTNAAGSVANTLLTQSGQVSMAISDKYVLVVDGLAGYLWDISTKSFSKIFDPDFPTNPVSCAYTKGFFIVTVANSQRFYIALSSSLTFSTGWDGLDYANAESNPDLTTGVIVYQDEIFFFGSRSVEVWNFTGNADFPMQRNTSVVIDHGCYAPLSVAKVSDSVLWLGTDKDGGLFVYMLNGYTAVPISDHECIQRISKLAYTRDAYSLSYSDDMHSFYILQFPSENHTEVYDLTSQIWSVWNYNDPISGELGRYRPSCHTSFNNKHLVGDYKNEKVYALSKDTYTDDGEIIVHDKVSIVNLDAFNYLTFKSIAFNMETGVGLENGKEPFIQYRHSDDFGNTWSNWRQASVGKIGNYRQIPKIIGLGAAKQRTMWIRFAEKCKFYVFGVVVDYE